MIKIRNFELELFEFYTLGAVFFTVLFALFIFKSPAICESVECDTYELSLPDTRTSSIFKTRNSVSPGTKIIIVDDSKTLTKYEDDIVSYNTHYYSLLLPYSLPNYTEKFGPCESSRQLGIAMKQLYNQIIRIGLVKDTSFIKSFRNMIQIIDKITSYQNNINTCLERKQKDPDYFCTENLVEQLEQLDQDTGKLSILLQRREQEVTYSLNKIQNPSTREAAKVISIINQHIIILSEVTEDKYNRQIRNRSTNLEGSKPPVVQNIIQTIEIKINPPDKKQE